MTICIGVIDDTGCTLVADGLGTSACVEIHDIPKIHTVGGVSFAVSGVVSGIEIMTEALECELARTKDKSVSLSVLSGILRRIVGEREWHPEADRGGRPPYWDMAFLLTDGRSLALICTDLSAAFVRGSMETVGTGNEMAVGAYYQAIRSGLNMHNAARNAVQITSKYSSGCGGQMSQVKVTSDRAILES